MQIVEAASAFSLYDCRNTAACHFEKSSAHTFNNGLGSAAGELFCQSSPPCFHFFKIMDKFLKSLQTKDALTANGALTNSSTLNECLNLFAIIGCRRNYSEQFWKAYGENPNLALKILFWSRDCRGGAGARMTFVEVMKQMQVTHPDVFNKLLPLIPYFGYWKDVYKFKLEDNVVTLIAETLSTNGNHSLCAKYAPRQGYGAFLIRKKLGLNQKDYRKFVVSKSQTVEQQMCANHWDEIKYETVPSVAGIRYANTFLKHDEERYRTYLDDAAAGKVKVNATVLTPADVIKRAQIKENRNCFDGDEALANATRAYWKNLPNFMEGCTERMLPIVDVSGSMYSGYYGGIAPIDAAIGLGLYISEHNEGVFHNSFITFSASPSLETLKSEDICDKIDEMRTGEWGANTNLLATFELILNQAKVHGLFQEDMPTKLLIISDMEFDCATNDETNFEAIDRMYAEAGYTRPGIIFWNVNGRLGNYPATEEDDNVAMVSGNSPSLMRALLQGKVLSPIDIMMEVVDTERYKEVHV